MPVPKNRNAPPTGLEVREGDVYTWPAGDAALWRIHRVGGSFPAAWNQFRTYGPLPSMRWDPQPPPTGDHPGYGVIYAASCPEVCLAEVFQADRQVVLSAAAPHFTAWQPVRDLRLLDLRGPWPLRHGASASLHARPRRVCRAWAAAVHDFTDPATGGGLDGLVTASTMFGDGAVVTLWATARGALPRRPLISLPLTDPLAAGLAAEFCADTGWPLLL